MSGGVDSVLLAKVAQDALGDGAPALPNEQMKSLLAEMQQQMWAKEQERHEQSGVLVGGEVGETVTKATSMGTSSAGCDWAAPAKKPQADRSDNRISHTIMIDRFIDSRSSFAVDSSIWLVKHSY